MWKLDRFVASIRYVKSKHRTSYASYHNTFEEAKECLIKRLRDQIEMHKRELSKKQALLRKVENANAPAKEGE